METNTNLLSRIILDLKYNREMETRKLSNTIYRACKTKFQYLNYWHSLFLS